jgi:hypothetical protein
MAHVNLAHNPLLPLVGDVVLVLGVLGEATSDVVDRGSWIKLHNSGREGHLLVWCLAKCTRRLNLGGGSGAVGSFFFHLPPAAVVVLVSGVEGGVVGVSTGICIGIPYVWGGMDG